MVGIYAPDLTETTRYVYTFASNVMCLQANTRIKNETQRKSEQNGQDVER